MHHLVEVLLESISDVLLALDEKALEVLQLRDAVLERFGAAGAKGLPGAIHRLLLLRHPVRKGGRTF